MRLKNLSSKIEIYTYNVCVTIIHYDFHNFIILNLLYRQVVIPEICGIELAEHCCWYVIFVFLRVRKTDYNIVFAYYHIIIGHRLKSLVTNEKAIL